MKPIFLALGIGAVVLIAGIYVFASSASEHRQREAKLQRLRDLGVVTSPEEINARIPSGGKDAADLLAEAEAMQAKIFAEDELRIYFSADPNYVRVIGTYGSSERSQKTYTPELFRKIRITPEIRQFAAGVDRVLEADRWGDAEDWSKVLPLKSNEVISQFVGVGALDYRCGVAYIDALQGNYEAAVRGFKAVEHGTDLIMRHPRLEFIRSAMSKKASLRYKVLSVLQEDPIAPVEMVAFARSLTLPRAVPWAISGELQALRNLLASPENLRPYQHSTTAGEVRGGGNWSASVKQRLAVETALIDFFISVSEATRENESEFDFARASRIGKLRRSDDEASQLAATFFPDNRIFAGSGMYFAHAHAAQKKLQTFLSELDKTKGGAAESAAPPR